MITFCGCKPSQKTVLSLIKSRLVLMKKAVEVQGEPQVHIISIGRGINELWRKLFGQH